MSASAGLRGLVEDEARAAGFDVIGIASAGDDPKAAQGLDAYLAAGHHGDMAWLAETADRRRSPRAMWPDAKSAVVLGLNYGPDDDPMALLTARSRGVISCYARGRDYHDIIKAGLKRVARRLQAATGADVKVFVDTAPLMEKPLAQRAGLGWQGKHTNLVSRSHGSWLFLGTVLTTAELEPDVAEADHCGSCRRCLDVCPTDAFPAPYQLDARRCIAYLTIEYNGHIPLAFRSAIGNRVFGCDDCLAVCPWNRFASAARDQRLAARSETDSPPLRDLLSLSEEAFRARFAGTPVKRTGRDRVVRNALIAAGNSGDATLLDPVRALLGDPSPLVRAMAVWAAARLTRREDLEGMAATYLPGEVDEDVRGEWTSALEAGA